MGKPAKAKNKEKKDKEKKDKEKSTKAGARKGQDGPTSASSWTPKTLDQQLRLMGLRVVDVVGDGNCFFRAVVRLPALSVIIELNCGIKYPEIRLTADNRVLAFVAALQGNPPLGALPSSTALIADAGRLPRFALLIASQGDQLYGKGARHKEVRETVCAHMEERREFYECFVEDDEGFDKYVRRMRRDGQWAGHMEVQATSEALGVNITIHQLGQPPWVVKNLDVGARMIHLSYHEGEHYNSVRKDDDAGGGPAEPIEALAKASGSGTWTDADVERVCMCTGVWDKDVVRAALARADGNVDEAVEALVAQVAGVDEGVDEDGDESAAEKTDGQAAQGDRKPCEEIPDGEAGQDYWRLPKGDASESGEGGARRGGGVEGRIDAGAEGPSGAEGYGARERESVGGVSGMAQQGAGSQGECSGESRGEDGKRNGCRDEVGVGEGRDGQIDGAGGVKGDRDYGDCSGREEKGVEGEEGEVAVRVGGRKARVKEGRGRPAERGPFPNRPCPCGSKKKYKQCCGAAAKAAERRRKAAGADADEVAAQTTLLQEIQVLHI